MKLAILAGFLMWCMGITVALAQPAPVRDYHLTIARQIVAIGGKPVSKITVNGTIPGPVLRFKEGDEAVIHVTNAMKSEATSIHWHGLLLPGLMDGAPGFNGFKGIAPGETFTYRFKIRQSGTYWYHAHTLGQEADGLYAGVVIDPVQTDTINVDRDYVVLLSDYHQDSAERILGNLKKSSEYYQYNRRTVGDLINDARVQGLGKALKSAKEWGKMRMLPTDLSDVTGYRFLVNGMDQSWTGLFTPGERVRLRFINASAMTMYDVRIPGLKMTVVSADGQPVQPIEVDEFRFGNAETYDVIVTPPDDKAYTIAAESLDRTGFALGTLAPRAGMTGEKPTPRPRAILSMGDMNMELMMHDDPYMDMSAMDLTSGWTKTGAPEGAKVLAYGDLKSLTPQTDLRDPTREIAVRLGGNMERYIWTINGKTFDPKHGFTLGWNERVRLTYVNETMMAHPVHLHGMFTQLENGQAAADRPNKHTVIVPPGQSVSVLLTANEAGDWPFHCHLLFHMASGMMTTVTVAAPDVAFTPPTQEKVEKAGGHHEHH
ncbi:multicopper oxidase family protein [Asticcacaulis sp. BYS171W]|uniref:Multicopper oxidase family protein n=1 Tax=Asticcacaulis aquaticus TaxID=2984212 RepID=A0ABT5HWW9_9CAUL|nr:multicopper oxidase family protein [Asticcacaulis aquaticus]MDC7684528.1 multicopper oxidase family protein [Asticcacaulis aquaticus]